MILSPYVSVTTVTLLQNLEERLLNSARAVIIKTNIGAFGFSAKKCWKEGSYYYLAYHLSYYPKGKELVLESVYKTLCDKLEARRFYTGTDNGCLNEFRPEDAYVTKNDGVHVKLIYHQIKIN